MPSILFLHCRSGGGRGPKNALIVPQERERERKEDERSAKRNGSNEGRPRNSPGLSIHRRQGGASRTEGEMVVEGNATALRIAFQWGRTLLAFPSLSFSYGGDSERMLAVRSAIGTSTYILCGEHFSPLSPIPHRSRDRCLKERDCIYPSLLLAQDLPKPREGGREGSRRMGKTNWSELQNHRLRPGREGGRTVSSVRVWLKGGALSSSRLSPPFLLPLLSPYVRAGFPASILFRMLPFSSPPSLIGVLVSGKESDGASDVGGGGDAVTWGEEGEEEESFEFGGPSSTKPHCVPRWTGRTSWHFTQAGHWKKKKEEDLSCCPLVVKERKRAASQ